MQTMYFGHYNNYIKIFCRQCSFHGRQCGSQNYSVMVTNGYILSTVSLSLVWMQKMIVSSMWTTILSIQIDLLNIYCIQVSDTECGSQRTIIVSELETEYSLSHLNLCESVDTFCSHT